MCDANYTITNCVASWPGSVHDARILRESQLFTEFEQPIRPIDGLILGDSGYMIREWLLTPIVNPQTAAQLAYNTAHSRTRSTVERCIGVVKRRFHCLHTELRVTPRKACRMTTVCMILHNKALALRLPLPENDMDDLDNVPVQAYRALQADAPERARTAAGKAVRDRIVEEYFNH